MKKASNVLKEFLGQPSKDHLRLFAVYLSDLAEFWGRKSILETHSGKVSEGTDHFFDSIDMYRSAVNTYRFYEENHKPPHKLIAIIGNLIFFDVVTGNHSFFTTDIIAWYQRLILMHHTAEINPIPISTRRWERFSLEAVSEICDVEIIPELQGVDFSEYLEGNMAALAKYHLSKMVEDTYKGPYPQYMHSPFDLYAMELHYLVRAKENLAGIALTRDYSLPQRPGTRTAPLSQFVVDVINYSPKILFDSAKK